MAPIAHLLCWIFIVVLLVRDSRRRVGVSLATWVPTLMLIVLSTRSPGDWLGLYGGASSGFANDRSGNPIDQIFYAGVIAASLAISLIRGVKWGKIFPANSALMAFYGYFILSSIWSTYPADSLIRILKDFGGTIIVISVILSEKKPLEAIRAVYARCACILIPLSAYLVKFSPLGKQYARAGEVTYIGAAVQKNSFGELLLVFMFFLIWDHLETRSGKGDKRVRLWSGLRWDTVVLLLIGIWLLELSNSQTSFVSLLMGLALVLRTGWLASPKVSRLVLAVALSLPILLLCTQEFSSVFTPLLESLGRDATFTGRTDIWKHITFTTVNPLIGAGFWNFWGGPGGRAIQIAMDTGVPNAHDGYLDIFLDGGLIGIFLLSCVLISCGWRLIKNLALHRYYQVGFAMLIIAIVHNVTETSFGRPSPLWFTTLLMIVNFPGLLDKLRRKPARASARSESKVETHSRVKPQPAVVDDLYRVRLCQETV